MKALGIDLAADPANTGAAFVELSDGRVVCRVVDGRLDDGVLVELATDVDVVGVDAPLGWPEPFVEALRLHREMSPWPATADPIDQRRRLSKRLTDRFVKKVTGLDPLPVAADRIAAVAMRAARLQTLLGEAWGSREDRAGTGRLVEVYPAAALKEWGLLHRGYKGKNGSSLRGDLVDALVAAAPWVDLDVVSGSCRSSDHCLDAVVSALVALAAKHGLTMLPANDERELAVVEGWIHLPSPDGSLSDLGKRLGAIA